MEWNEKILTDSGFARNIRFTDLRASNLRESEWTWLRQIKIGVSRMSSIRSSEFWGKLEKSIREVTHLWLSRCGRFCVVRTVDQRLSISVKSFRSFMRSKMKDSRGFRFLWFPIHRFQSLCQFLLLSGYFSCVDNRDDKDCGNRFCHLKPLQ
jgi:hypothetical protein